MEGGQRWLVNAPKKPDIQFPESLLVARPVSRAEVFRTPAAQAALRKAGGEVFGGRAVSSQNQTRRSALAVRSETQG
eukprot:1068507-Alexandrium_andersonii.AAC.1